MKTIKKLLQFGFLASVLFFYKAALAVDTEVDEVSGLPEYLSNLIRDFILPVVGGIAVLMMIYAGYLYMTSQGNPDSINKAKDIIIGVITGIVLLFLIEIILSQIGVK